MFDISVKKIDFEKQNTIIKKNIKPGKYLLENSNKIKASDLIKSINSKLKKKIKHISNFILEIFQFKKSITQQTFSVLHRIG